MKADFRRALLARPYKAGPASGERPALLERLRAELGEVEAAEERLVDELLAHGIVVAHRDEVVKRRETERRDRDNAERKRQDERWLEEQKRRGHLGTVPVHTAHFKPSQPAPTGRE
jgi:hypothetical protein